MEPTPGWFDRLTMSGGFAGIPARLIRQVLGGAGGGGQIIGIYGEGVMRIMAWGVAAGLGALSVLAAGGEEKAKTRALTPAEIVEKADEVRNPRKDYTVEVKVTSVEVDRDKKEKKSVASYEVLVKGKDKTLIKTLTPPADRGQTLLMTGSDMWTYSPEVSQPIRVSLRDRLIGEVANGDIARANLAGDYTAKILKTETVGDKECHVLDLKAAADDTTYDRIVYWVEKGTYHPVKAEFYSESGGLWKTCAYEAYKTIDGRLRPSKMIIKGAAKVNQNNT
ncbi:MAG: outer membrane lipoprotein-sorting protein, partial [Planctomycetota bacterium]